MSLITLRYISYYFQALQASKYEDWFWKVALGKCYFRLGMFRDAERMFKSALKMQEMIDILLLLAKVSKHLYRNYCTINFNIMVSALVEIFYYSLNFFHV